MQTNLETLFEDLTALCSGEESSFYSVDHVRNGVTYRVFTYRLASYTEFQQRNAIECRGHTFRLDGENDWTLASLPMQKFFNYGEHIGWGTDLNLSTITCIMDKADGSLISTVNDGDGGFFLKSKTSFTSQQAIDAQKLLNSDNNLNSILATLNAKRFTVNMEYVAPDNQIVIGYDKPQLIVLNARHRVTGEYINEPIMEAMFGDYLIKSFPIPANPAEFMVESEKMLGIEGFVIKLDNGLMFKHKTEAYCILHHLKDSINCARKLWEACITGTTDDLRALFKDDPISVARIIDMEEKASRIYNHVEVSVENFYKENKDLDRKSYAIKGQEILNKDGTFSLAMNLYIGRDSGVKNFLIKHYKSYGISDDVAITSE